MKLSRLLLGVFGVSAAVALASAAYAQDEDNEHEDKGGEHVRIQQQAASHHHEHEKDGNGEHVSIQQQGVSQSVKLSNLIAQPLEDVEIGFSGKDAGDFHQTNDCGEKLAGNASCTINVWFAPKTRGPKSATMEIQTSGGKQSVPLSGDGV